MTKASEADAAAAPTESKRSSKRMRLNDGTMVEVEAPAAKETTTDDMQA